MTINIKKDVLIKSLICLGALFTIFAIFCFFGAGTEFRYESEVSVGTANLFNWMFGTKNALLVPGLTVLFVFELIALLLSIVLIVLLFLNKLNKKQLTICLISLAILLLVCAILAFCTKYLILNAEINEIKRLYSSYYDIDTIIEATKESFKYIHISAGPISYGVLALIGCASYTCGVILLNLKENK